MKITLKNIKQHEDFSIDIPDSGVVLLKGPSGIGKSTILEAMEEALFGGVDGLTTWGKSKHEVELEAFGLVVKRTKGPKSLTVLKDGVEYKDDVAQAEICKTLGMSLAEFEICSYIKQESKNSLLKLTPGEQQKVIESIAAGEFDVEKIKSIISDKISSIKSEIKTKEQILQMLEASLENHSVSQEPTMPDSSGLDVLNAVVSKESEVRSSIDKKKSAISELRNELSSPYHAIVDKISAMKSYHVDLKAKISEGREGAKKELSEISLEKPNHDSKKAELMAKTDWLNTRSRLFKIAGDLAAKEPESQTSGKPLLEFMKEKRDIYNSELMDTIKECSQLEESIKAASYGHSNTQNCPDCHHDLAIVGGKIISAKDHKIDPELIASLRENLQTKNSESLSLQEKIKWLDGLYVAGEDAKSKLGSDPLPDVKDHQGVQEMLESLSAEEKQYNERANKALLLKASIADFDAQELKISEDLEKEEQKLVALVKPRSKDDISSLIAKEESELDNLSADLSRISDAKVAISEYNSKLSLYNRNLEIRNKELEELKNKKIKRDDAKKDLNASNDTLASYVLLKERSDFAASSAVEGVLDVINTSAMSFIESMFGGATSITIRATSTTKKGDERAKFSTEIFHKGQEANSLKELSGGEKSRACLAYQLGLSEMYKSPILMVDEGFSGLDDETKEQCLEALREVSQDKLILVVEHGVPEAFFDEVINV